MHLKRKQAIKSGRLLFPLDLLLAVKSPLPLQICHQLHVLGLATCRYRRILITNLTSRVPVAQSGF